MSEEVLRNHIHGRGAARCQEHGEQDAHENGGVQVNLDKKQYRHRQKREGHHERMNRIVGEMENCLYACEEGKFLFKQLRNYLYSGLDRSLCPSKLLVLERIDVFRQLGRDFQFGHVLGFPVAELHSVRKVHVLGERVMVPAAARFDGFSPENARGSVEVHEEAVPASSGLLDHEVAVDPHGLTAGNERRLSV